MLENGENKNVANLREIRGKNECLSDDFVKEKDKDFEVRVMNKRMISRVGVWFYRKEKRFIEGMR